MFLNLSGRVLLERLKEFEIEGVIKWEVILEMFVCIEYFLMEKGCVLVFILEEIFKWFL